MLKLYLNFHIHGQTNTSHIAGDTLLIFLQATPFRIIFIRLLHNVSGFYPFFSFAFECSHRQSECFQFYNTQVFPPQSRNGVWSSIKASHIQHNLDGLTVTEVATQTQPPLLYLTHIQYACANTYACSFNFRSWNLI